MYQKAWALLLKRIESKTSWGKNELKQLMLECLSNPEQEELSQLGQDIDILNNPHTHDFTP